MDLKKHLEQGWSNTLKFIGPVLLITFVQIIVIIFSLGFLAPVTTAGYFQSLLLAQREGRTPEIRDLFSQMSLFLPLLLFGFVVMIAVVFGFMLLILPGFAVTVLLIFACLYMLPLMTDKGLGLIEALKESWAMAVKDPIGDHIIISLVYMGILSVGGSLPFVILAAQPLATFILLSFYEERVGGNSGSMG